MFRNDLQDKLDQLQTHQRLLMRLQKFKHYFAAMKQNVKLISLASCLLLSISLVITIFLATKDYNRRIGNFIRLSPPHSLDYTKDFKLDDISIDFLGKSRDKIFLGSRDQPTKLFVTDTLLSALHCIHFKVEKPVELYRADLYLQESGKFFLWDGTQPFALSAQLPDTVLSGCDIGKNPFLKALPLDSGKITMNQFNPGLNQNVYRIYDNRNHQFSNEVYAPQRKGDGVFSIDGVIQFDSSSQRFIYVYFYRNRFDCLDKHMHLIYQGRTIDNVTESKIQIASLGSAGRQIIANAPLVVNKQSCLTKEYLYIRSGVAAKNDPKNIMDDCAVIDVYSPRTGKYLRSLYAFHFRGYPLRSFQVIGHYFFGLYGPYLSLWRIHWI